MNDSAKSRAALAILALSIVLTSRAARADGPESGEARPLLSWARVVAGLELGVAAMNESGPFGFSNGVGSVTRAGPAWGAQAGLEFFDWLAVDVRYTGSRMAVQSSAAPTGSVAFVSSATDLTLRLSLPLRWVHPYLFGGVGYNQVSLIGSQTARAGSPLHSSGQTELPMGVGVDVPLTARFSAGFEATYHFQLSEDYSEDESHGIDGGDISTFNALVRARF